MRKLIVAAATAALLAGCAVESGGDEPDKPDPTEVVGEEYGAQDVCRQFVEDRLKSPGSAEFSDEKMKQVRGPVWQVTGVVDSENAFGALIRNEFTCRVKFTGDDNWRLQKMGGLNR